MKTVREWLGIPAECLPMDYQKSNLFAIMEDHNGIQTAYGQYNMYIMKFEYDKNNLVLMAYIFNPIGEGMDGYVADHILASAKYKVVK